MKILHTSDWHLGEILMSQSREEEHTKFLNWLIDTIEKEKIDMLLIAGDIFDTVTPPIYAQKLYFNFLYNLSKTGCKNCVVLAGNHDSASLLASSKEILSLLSIKVVEERGEIIEFDDFIFLAVPYLREKVITSFISNQDYKESEKRYIEAIKSHYLNLYKEISDKNKKIISSGHLTIKRAKKSESERELYIGNLAAIESSFFENLFDYTLLGHFHRPQKIGKSVIYSGSAIPLGFDEAKYEKSVFILDTENLKEKRLNIPTFRKLYELKGDEEEIEEKLQNIEEKSWCKIVLQNEIKSESFIEKLFKIAKERDFKILAVKYETKEKENQNSFLYKEHIANLTPLEIFKRRLKEEDIKDKNILKDLINLYEKVVNQVEIGNEI